MKHREFNTWEGSEIYVNETMIDKITFNTKTHTPEYWEFETGKKTIWNTIIYHLKRIKRRIFK